jgi:hypothetical protein
MEVQLGDPAQSQQLMFDVNNPTLVVYTRDCFQRNDVNKSCNDTPFNVNGSWSIVDSNFYQNYSYDFNKTAGYFSSGIGFDSPLGTD